MRRSSLRLHAVAVTLLVAAQGTTAAAAADTQAPVVTSFSFDEQVEEGNEIVITLAADDTGTGGSDLGYANVWVDGVLIAKRDMTPAYVSPKGVVYPRYVVKPGPGIREVCAAASDAAGNSSDVTCQPLDVLASQAPVIRELSVTPAVIGLGGVLDIRLVADDTQTGGSRLREGSARFTDGGCCGATGFSEQESDSIEFTSTIGPLSDYGNATAGTFPVCATVTDWVGNTSETACATVTVIDDVRPRAARLRVEPAGDVLVGESVRILGSGDDRATGRSDITGFVMTVDDEPADLARPLDGAWDSSTEEFEIVVEGLPTGYHFICGNVLDAAGNKSWQQCASVRVVELAPPTITVLDIPATVVSGEPFDVSVLVDDSTTGGSRLAYAVVHEGPSIVAALKPDDGAMDSPTERMTASVRLESIGTHTLCFSARDLYAASGLTSCRDVEVTPWTAAGAGTISSVGSPVVEDASFVFDLVGTSEGEGEGSFTFTDGLMQFEATSVTALFVSESTHVSVSGTGLRNGVEECSFSIEADEAGWAAGEPGRFGVHLACTTSSYAFALDYNRIPSVPLTSGSIEVHGA